MTDPTQNNEQPEGVILTDEQQTARKKRNVAIGLGLAALVIIFYGATVVKFGPKLMDRPIISLKN